MQRLVKIGKLRQLPSRRVNGEDCTAASVIIEGFELDDGKRALIYWNAVDVLTETYEGTLSLEIYGKVDTVCLVDLRDGGIYRLPESMTENIGAGGVRLINFPLTDCPLAILFN